MKDRVTVIMAAFNGEQFIEKQLKSIINQSLPPYKIIINIDKSDDDTLIVVNNLKKKYSNLMIINSGEIFGSAAANFINLISNTDLTDVDYIALADQDDIWKEDKLKKAIHNLGQGFDGYSSNVDAFWENGRKKTILKNQLQQKFDYLFESAGPGCTFVLTKILVLELQQFLKKSQFKYINNYHDWLIYAFARKNGFNWYIDSYSSVNYRQHSKNVFGANIGIKAFLSRANRVLSGEGVDFAFRLMKEFNIQDSFLRSLFPVNRINLLRLGFRAKHFRRRVRDQFYFFFACMLLAIIFPKKLRDI